MRGRFTCLLLAFTLIAQAAEDQISAFRRGLYREPRVGPNALDDSPRIAQLIRAGNLYLSLQDAISLAIENNLDVAFQRLNTPISQTETLRAKGGGTLRGISTNVFETPSGIGGPGAPLITAAAGGATTTTELPAYSSDLAIISEAQTNNSVFSQTPYAPGPPVPMFDPALVGQVMAEHSSTPEADLLVAGSPVLVQRNVTADLGYQQGFSTGTQINASFNNNFINSNAKNDYYNPYATSNAGLNVTQPLLRGFGIALNRRFITISKNNQRVTDLVFKEQLISTVSGVIRLYQDLVALNEDVKVKQETLTLAQRLLSDNKHKVDVGTLAPVEATRAQAQVASARQDLINSQGYVRQQELILLNVLTKRFTADPLVRSARIVPTDSIDVPGNPEMPTVGDLINQANVNRPDLLYAGIQVENSEVYLKGSKNELRPELDLVGIAQNSGLAGPFNPAFVPSTGAVVGPQDSVFLGNYGDTLNQIARRAYPTYGIGINLTLPLRNRVAEADVIRDELQVRQTEIKRQQLVNQVRLEVEDALVALDRSRQALDAATEARKLQEESLRIEQERYTVGLSTTFLVLQYQSFLAQARSTEIASKSSYAKARTALDRAVGLTLERNNVSVAAAFAGKTGH